MEWRGMNCKVQGNLISFSARTRNTLYTPSVITRDQNRLISKQAIIFINYIFLLPDVHSFAIPALQSNTWIYTHLYFGCTFDSRKLEPSLNRTSRSLIFAVEWNLPQERFPHSPINYHYSYSYFPIILNPITQRTSMDIKFKS